MHKSRQSKNSAKSEFPGLWDRLTKALGTDKTGEIAEIFEVPDSTVSEWKNYRRTPSLRHLIKTVELSNVGMMWLLTGKEDQSTSPPNVFPENYLPVDAGISEAQLSKMLSFYDREIRKLMKRNGLNYEQAVKRAVEEGLIALGLATRTVKNPVKFKEVDYELVMVPIVGRIAAGRPIEPIQDVRWQPCPRIWKVNEDVVMLEVNGDSMRDAGINDGDLVLVNKSRMARRGDKIAALIDGEVTVKFYEPENGRIRLDPANPDYDPIYVHEHQTFEIYGVVIATVQV